MARSPRDREGRVCPARPAGRSRRNEQGARIATPADGRATDTAGADRLAAAAASLRLPAGPTTFAETIPSVISTQPLVKGYLIAARGLELAGEIDLDDEAPITASQAAFTIGSAMRAAIAARMPELPGLPECIGVSVYFTAEGLAVAVTTGAFQMITPNWFNRRNLSNRLKQQIYSVAVDALKSVQPLGASHDLIEHISMMNFGGETDDEAARQYLEDSGHDSDDLPPLPSDYKKAMPSWGRVLKNPDVRALPDHLRRAARSLMRATRRFDARNPDWASYEYDELCSFDAAYEEMASEPPIWFFPCVPDLTNALDEIMNYAMQMGINNICSFARLNSPEDVKQWLDAFSEASKLLVQAQQFMDLCDNEYGAKAG